MASTTVTVRVESEIKKRLEKLAKSTGRTRSFLAAEALKDYLDLNEWQVAGIKKAMASLDQGEGIPHVEVRKWVESWDGKREAPVPRRLKK
jgi:RHH-type rel operon transcriptional repressor/antitoxin RelB